MGSQETGKPFAINSYAYTLDLAADAFLTRLAGRGYREFELMVYPGHLWPKTMPATARAALRRHADSLGAHIVTLNMANIDVNVAAASEDEAGDPLRRQLRAILAELEALRDRLRQALG